MGVSVTVRIEVARGGFVKPRANGTIDFRSPLPSPFNYGCVPDRVGGDGDPLDAIVLGPGRAVGAEVATHAWAVVRFLDAGNVDDKLVCGDSPPGPRDRWLLIAFFRVYAAAKSLLNLRRGQSGDTRFLGLEALP